jgi:hypothetical protein
VVIAALVACGCLTASAGPAAAQTPGTLVGETLQATPAYDAQGDCASAAQCVQATATCDADANSTVSYTASGTAVGPYPGTFTASGSVTFGPQVLPSFTGIVPSPAGANVSLTESFTIHSGATTITGTKRLAANVIPFVPGAGVGSCRSLPGGYAYADSASATYTATITDPTGSVTRTGATALNFSRSSTTDCGSAPVCNSGNFAEAFYTQDEGSGPAATLRLDPRTATNEVGGRHCVIATVTDASGRPVPDVTVRFTVAGSVSTSGSRTTGSDGKAEFCYAGPSFPGADTLRAFADTDRDSSQDPGEPFDVATKTWVLPATTPLCEVKITQGGRITAANGDKATFGGNARASAAGSVSGQEQYTDHGPAQPLMVKATSILAITCSQDRREATIFGRATVNGSGSHYFRIRVADNGEPGRNDVYGILLSTGYFSGDQRLEGGNVQIH